MPNKQILLRYAELKIQASKLEEEMEMLKAQCLEEIKALRGDTDSPIELSELPGYKFSTMKRKTWTYSEYVKDAEKVLKARKKDEEADGTASFVETETLIFKSPKE